MLFSQTAVYSLRAMAVLAALPPMESLRSEDLSRRTGAPVQYLVKVMRRLVLAGLVRSQRGHGGGFALARAPKAIRIRDVLAAVDCAVESSQCAFGIGDCDPGNPCALHPIWSRFQGTLHDWAEGSTLADLGPEPRAPRRRER